MVYAPASFVRLVVTTPLAVLVAVMETPGNIAPVASETVPVSVALFACPNDVVTQRHDTIIQSIALFMFSPPGRQGREIPHAVDFQPSSLVLLSRARNGITANGVMSMTTLREALIYLQWTARVIRVRS